MGIHQLAREFFGTTSGGTTAQRLSEKRCTAQHRFAGVRCDMDRKVFRLGVSVERGIFPGSWATRIEATECFCTVAWIPETLLRRPWPHESLDHPLLGRGVTSLAHFSKDSLFWCERFCMLDDGFFDSLTWTWTTVRAAVFVSAAHRTRSRDTYIAMTFIT